MSGTPCLTNWGVFDAVPAALLRGRGSATQRLLSGARWVLRRTRDGRYLAVVHADGRWTALQPAALRAVLGRRTMAQVVQALVRPAPRPGSGTLPLGALRDTLAQLGIDAGYGRLRGLPLVPEPRVLASAGLDRYRRPLWLTSDAAMAWTAMRAAAARDGVALEAISGFRGHAYQLGIVRRKLARGLSLDAILQVNAAPGYSEHHSGRALDIGTPDEPPAEDSFEHTAAFAWLQARAAGFGFRMSYPRDNPHGIVYEPWHWCWHAPSPRAACG